MKSATVATVSRPTARLTMLVPLMTNGGRRFQNQYFEHFEQYVTEIAGGISREADVFGRWRKGKRTYRDHNRRYFTNIGIETADTVAPQIASYIRRHFRQHAAYLEISQTKIVGF